jgi:hypothetical protein
MSKKQVKRYYCLNCGNVQMFTQGNECKKCQFNTEEISMPDKYKENIKKKLGYLSLIVGLFSGFLFWLGFASWSHLNPQMKDFINPILYLLLIITFFISPIFIIYFFIYAKTKSIKLNNSEARVIGHQKFGQPSQQSVDAENEKMQKPDKLLQIGALLILLSIFFFPMAIWFSLIPFFILIFTGIIFIIIRYLYSNASITILQRQYLAQKKPIANIPSLLESKKVEEFKVNKNINLFTRLEKLLSTNPNVFVDDIKKEIEKRQYRNAEKLLTEREQANEEFKHLEKQLKSLNNTKNNLTKRLAEGELSSSAFETARDDLEQEKKKLEEELWKLKSILFKDEYEKPF